MSAVIRRRPSEISGRLYFLENNPSPFADSILVSDSIVVPIGFPGVDVPDPQWGEEEIRAKGFIEDRQGRLRFVAQTASLDLDKWESTERQIFPSPFLFE